LLKDLIYAASFNLLGICDNRYLKSGLRQHGISQSFSIKGLEDLYNYISKHKRDLDAISNKLSNLPERIHYPDMKIIDMYFFQYSQKIAQYKSAA